MPLTELQLPTKNELYRNVQSVASEVKRTGLKLQEMSEFLADLDTTDFDALSVPVGQVRTDLINFRNAIDAVVTAINAQETALDVVRYMMIV